jgi:hypothetical protein
MEAEVLPSERESHSNIQEAEQGSRFGPSRIDQVDATRSEAILL